MSYLKSLLSIKKLTHKKVSLLSVWDSQSKFTKKSHILGLAKLKNVEVDEYSRIGFGCSIANATVGKFTAIGKGSRIGLGRHPINYLSTNSIFYRKGQFNDAWCNPIEYEESLPISIGNDVWIGVDSIIMDGVTIGDGAIVAAGSVVTKDVPPYSIVGGVSAKVLKYRFDKEVIERLQEIQWWLLSDVEISKRIKLFNTPDLTIDIINNYFDK
jgi:acetyltransferase-like isoleucine patch superfamily enzyme